MNEPMKKPIVFFSHSSKDEKPLRKLKALIDDKTRGSVIIFLTSDGQSIPFGRNWVYKVEEALDDSSLMFVFVSPNSLQSNWIYFEAGYAYSKDVKVVPVGILGVDLSEIKPPLSLLQGFNLDKGDALGNIIAIINETYDLKFDTTFEEDIFDELFTLDNSDLKNHLVSQVLAIMAAENEQLFFDILIDKLDKQNLNPVRTENTLYAYGLRVEYQLNKDIKILINGLVTKIYLPIIHEMLKTDGVSLKNCGIGLSDSYVFTEDFQRFTALLKDTEIRIAEKGRLTFEGIIFWMRPPSLRTHNTPVSAYSIMIDGDKTLVTHEWLTRVTRLLYKSGAIFPMPSQYVPIV